MPPDAPAPRFTPATGSDLDGGNRDLDCQAMWPAEMEEGAQKPQRIAGDGLGLDLLQQIRTNVVVMLAVITENGRLEEISFKPQLPPEVEAALRRNLATWRFRPALDAQGNAVRVCYGLTVNIHLR